MNQVESKLLQKYFHIYVSDAAEMLADASVHTDMEAEDVTSNVEEGLHLPGNKG